jgi:MFS family permease
MFPQLESRIAPFRHRHFRNFFFVQTLSLVGSFSHDLARSWIIVETLGKAGALGNLQMAIAIPCLFFILQGGVLVDHADVRKVMMWTKSLLGIACVILALLTEFSTLQYWHLLVFGIVEGLIVSFDSPAFQALTVRLVPREEFQQAIAINSTNFHASRMLGPIVAAFLMSFHGPSLVFLFDGLTYLLVVIVLSGVQLRKMPARPNQAKGLKPLIEGLKYIFSTATIRYRLLQLMLTIGIVFPLMISVFRVYMQQKFQLSAAQYGWVFAFPALGSMTGALTFAITKPKMPLKALLVGVPALTVCLLILPIINYLSIATIMMSAAGFFMYLNLAALTVSLQLEVDENYRGRMSSVIGMGFAAIGPLMSSPWGHLADVYGAPKIVTIAALLFGCLSFLLGYAYSKTKTFPQARKSTTFPPLH